MFSWRKPGLFVSYRRSETAGYSGRICEKLEHVFGKQRVFRDVEDILPGETFPQKIGQALAASSTLVVLIGPQWAGVTNAQGARRLDQPDDFVRTEIERALERRLKIIPVLILGAKMPNAADLPASLRPLCDSQALELSDERWDYDMGRLLHALGASQQKAVSVWRERMIGIGIAVALLVAAVFTAAHYLEQRMEPSDDAHALSNWRPPVQPGSDPSRPPLQPSASGNPPFVPSASDNLQMADFGEGPTEDEVAALVRQSLLDLNSAMIAGDFSAFYQSLSWRRRQETTQQDFHASYLGLMGVNVGPDDIRSGQIAFRSPPTVMFGDMLMSTGIISNRRVRAAFDARYVFEGGAWKLYLLAVQMM